VPVGCRVDRVDRVRDRHPDLRVLAPCRGAVA